jgi:NAD(P)-dependent dehydrogenase (short-subunit alcohol dehydrogenase family)
VPNPLGPSAPSTPSTRGGLKNRVAIVTGGAGGIGESTVAQLATAGATVITADLGFDATSLEPTSSPSVLRVGCDVSDERSVRQLFDLVERAYSGIDILINNAGVDVSGDIQETTSEEFERVLSVNLTGVFLCSREFLRRRLPERGPRSIVNTASINGDYADERSVAYSTSKGGVIALTRAMAMDHATDGVRVNCVCPGWIDTPMARSYLDESEERSSHIAELHALGRVGQPCEVAAAIVFLASEAASLITGAALTIDGGRTAGETARFGGRR